MTKLSNILNIHKTLPNKVLRGDWKDSNGVAWAQAIAMDCTISNKFLHVLLHKSAHPLGCTVTAGKTTHGLSLCYCRGKYNDSHSNTDLSCGAKQSLEVTVTLIELIIELNDLLNVPPKERSTIFFKSRSFWFISFHSRSVFESCFKINTAFGDKSLKQSGLFLKGFEPAHFHMCSSHQRAVKMYHQEV